MSNVYWDSNSESGSGTMWYAEGVNPVRTTSDTYIWGQRTLERSTVRQRGTMIDELPPHRMIFETPLGDWWNGTMPETSFMEWLTQTRESIEKQSGIKSKQKPKYGKLHDSLIEAATTFMIHDMIRERWEC